MIFPDDFAFFKAMWIIGVLLSLGFLGFLIWVIIKLLEHWSII